MRVRGVRLRGSVPHGRWKLLMSTTGERRELYDLLADPAEQHNLADENPQVVRSLRAKLAAWYEEVQPPARKTNAAGK